MHITIPLNFLLNIEVDNTEALDVLTPQEAIENAWIMATSSHDLADSEQFLLRYMYTQFQRYNAAARGLD